MFHLYVFFFWDTFDVVQKYNVWTLCQRRFEYSLHKIVVVGRQPLAHKLRAQVQLCQRGRGEQRHIYEHMETHNSRLEQKKKVMATRTHNTHALLGSIATRFTTLPGPPLSVNT